MLEIQFLRENLLKADVVYLDKEGNLIIRGEGTRGIERPKKGVSQTFSLTWKDGENQETTTLPMTLYNMGRKVRG